MWTFSGRRLKSKSEERNVDDGRSLKPGREFRYVIWGKNKDWLFEDVDTLLAM